MYTREAFISEGFKGKVYIVKSQDSGKNYAMKVEYISGPNDLVFKNELKFIKEVASKHPDQFIQLIDYRFVKNCQESSPKYNTNLLSQYSINWLKKLRSLKFCIEKVYTLVDTILRKINIQDLTLQQRYSCIIQVMYVIHLLESNGYVHGDFHDGNIGVIKVPVDKHIMIFDELVPTFGYQYQAIDYGSLLHEKTASKTRLFQEFQYKTEYEHFHKRKLADKYGVITKMYSEQKFWKYLDDNNLKPQNPNYKEELLNSPEAKVIKIQEPDIKYKMIKILFTKKYQQTMLGSIFKKTIPLEFFIPVEDIIFCYQNFNNTKKIIEYLIYRLNEI